jgi:hypothetical protein
MNPTVASMDVDITDSQQPFPRAPMTSPAPPKIAESSAGQALPNLSKRVPANILTDIHIHDIHKYAMEAHLQLQAEQGSLPENTFDIPGDLTSMRMGMLGDAARIGNRHQKHVLPFVENVEGYFQRTALHVMKDIERGREELEVEEAIAREAESLVADLSRGLI